MGWGLVVVVVVLAAPWLCYFSEVSNSEDKKSYELGGAKMF